MRTLEQWPWLEQPGDGQHVDCFSPSQLAHDGEAGEEEDLKRCWEQRREEESGMHQDVQGCR